MRLYSFSLIIFLLWTASLQAQVCTGNLGDNIFTEGDFGSGTANLLSPNPNIAPGYSYTFSVPPEDGQYVITNNTGVWGGLYSSWLATGDNSSDPNGYMMVVNSSFDAGLFYEQEVEGLCGGTLYEFSADILNIIRTPITDHIEPNVSFLLDGVEQFSTGNIPQNEQWINFGFTFTTDPGQEMLTLSLRNNAPGGFGNDLAIDNISFRACGPEALILPEEVANICEDGSPIELVATVNGNQYANPAYQWQQSFDMGVTWENIVGEMGETYLHTQLAGGMYYYRFLLADGNANLNSEFCRVNSNVKIVNVIPKEYLIVDTICNGLTYEVGSSIYTESGIYVDSLLNFLGCDSILTTDLTVLEDAGITAGFLIESPSCFDASNGSITIENVMNGTPPYQFTFDEIDVGMGTFFPDLAGGETYEIVIVDNFGCSSEMAVFVENAPDLMLDLGGNATVNLGETVTISPLSNFQPTDFLWESITPIDCGNFEDCQKFDFLPTTSQQVALTLFNDGGCTISDSIFIEVVEVRDAFFPNVFSPNNDGINDVFTLFGNSPNVQMVEEFKIFDRWGGLIFDGGNFPPNDLQNGWDGTFNGKEVSMGIYVYTATVRFIDEQVLRYSGDVFLIK